MINKIVKVLDYFIKENKDYSKVWNIGTDVFLSWKRMVEKFNKSSYSVKRDSFIVQHLVSNDLKDRYQMLLNGDNVTPANKLNDVAWGTMRQYLQIGSSLGLIDWQGKIPEKNNKIFIQLNPKFWQIDINNIDSELTDLFLKTLFISIDNHIEWIRNFGLTLFLSMILKENENIFYQFPKDYCVFTKTSRNKILDSGKIFLSTTQGIDYIKYINGIKTKEFNNDVKDAYSRIANKILSKYSFDKILDKLTQIIVDPEMNEENIFDDDFVLNKQLEINKIKKEKLESYLKELQNRRCELRQNIKINRVGTNDENAKYSDLVNSNPNDIQICLQEACHIYDIYKLKNKLSEYIKNTNIDQINEFQIESILDEASDFNNGIFMNRSAHKVFDKNYAWFNEEGKLIYQESCKSIVENAFGKELDNVYIKRNALTDQMKKYIAFRNKYNIK